MKDWLHILHGLAILFLCWITGSLRKLRESEESWRYHKFDPTRKP